MHNSQLPEIASGITRISHAHTSLDMSIAIWPMFSSSRTSFVFRFIAAVGATALAGTANAERNAHEANETNPSKVIALASVAAVRCAKQSKVMWCNADEGDRPFSHLFALHFRAQLRRTCVYAKCCSAGATYIIQSAGVFTTMWFTSLVLCYRISRLTVSSAGILRQIMQRLRTMINNDSIIDLIRDNAN